MCFVFYVYVVDPRWW